MSEEKNDSNKNSDLSFAFISVILVVFINFLTFLSKSFFEIQGIHEITYDNFIIFPILWGMSVFYTLRFFKKLPLFLRQPTIRIILWSPIVFLDFIDDRSGYNDSPSYILYLFNTGLLPFTNFLLLPLDKMENFYDRLIYSNIVLWIGFAVIQALILFCAERIQKSSNNFG